METRVVSISSYYLKLRILSGLLLLLFNSNAQSSWEVFKVKNTEAFYLINSNIAEAERINDSLFLKVEEPLDSLVLSDMYSVRGSIYFNKGGYEESLKNNLIALKIRENLRDSLKMKASYSNIGNVYYYTNAFKKSNYYLKKALEFSKLMGQPKYLSSTNYNTIGLNYQSLRRMNSSRITFYQGLKTLDNAPEGYEETRANLLGNLGGLYISLDSNQKAFQYLDSAYHINVEINNLVMMSWDLMRLGSVYLKLNLNEKALYFLNKADSIAQVNSRLEVRKDIYYYKCKYYLNAGKVDSSLKYLQIYNILQDSIISMKTDENIQYMEARVKYQVEKKEAAEALREEQRETTNKFYLIIALISLIVIVGAYVFTYTTFRQKRKMSRLELELKENEMRELMSNQESEALNAMLKGQEEERERIAKELHDGVGGTLAALKLTLRKEGNVVDEEDLKTVDLAVMEVRNIAHNLSSGLLEKQGLGVALKELKANIERTGKLKFNLFLQSGLAEVRQEAAIELYRIVQELTNNTIKHAQATEISLQTNVNEESFNLIFEDDGIGFDKKTQIDGMGIRNIEARVKKINGNFHLDSQLGRGTIAIIEIERKT
ncbi:MAG: sensor histidine kinase [Flavobacteriales bacterium]|nr:sensor histidine kinase [Flavobacteriales bacterium]